MGEVVDRVCTFLLVVGTGLLWLNAATDFAVRHWGAFGVLGAIFIIVSGCMAVTSIVRGRWL